MKKTQVEIGNTTKVRLYLKNVCDRTIRNVILLLIANTLGNLFYCGRGDIWKPVVSWDIKNMKPGDEIKLEVDIKVTAPVKQISFKARFYGDSGKRLLQEIPEIVIGEKKKTIYLSSVIFLVGFVVLIIGFCWGIMVDDETLGFLAIMSLILGVVLSYLLRILNLDVCI